VLISSSRSLLSNAAQCQTVPIVENRSQFTHVLQGSRAGIILLRHCNIFEIAPLLQDAQRSGIGIYVYVDHIEGIHPDAAGMRYLAEQLHITGILSNHPRTLVIGKGFGLETIQRIFAIDSTGLEMALESVDVQYTNLLDIAPALVVPHVASTLKTLLPLPFMASGLISTSRQVQAVLQAGALCIAVSRPELWP
jgi:glycerol uptake operon antiterminator